MDQSAGHTLNINERAALLNLPRGEKWEENEGKYLHVVSHVYVDLKATMLFLPTGKLHFLCPLAWLLFWVLFGFACCLCLHFNFHNLVGPGGVEHCQAQSGFVLGGLAQSQGV